ncbi:unnamed protein product [Polarella glacialis]|uniref:Uncharacterized protein n=1 Tax=Polarella glacialis TaxID=89957 RepID=A0A813LTX0_POLGL|nr:unnamed protein product [Polarella glacialis]
MSDASDTSELAPEVVDPIEPDRFGLRWQGASHGSPGGATAWLLTLPAAGRIILLTSEGVIEGGVASPGRGVPGGRAITLDPDTVRAHPPRLLERLNGTEGKVHLCRTLPCTRIHLSSDTGNGRSPLVPAMAFARCPESDPTSQLDLGAVWAECRTDAPQPTPLCASIETDLPPVALAAPEGAPAEEAQGSEHVVAIEATNGRRRHVSKSPQLETEFSMNTGEDLEQDRPPTPRMSWFLDHTFDTTADQAWYSKVAAKLKWTSQVPLGDHDSQIIQHLSDPKVAFSILAVLCVVTYSSMFPGPAPGGVFGSALYYTARIAAVVAVWLWHFSAAFMGPVVSSLVFGSVGAWCVMSAGVVAASSVGAAAFVSACSRAAAAVTHPFGTAAGSAGVNAGAAPSSGPAPTSGSAEGQAPGGAGLGIAKTSEATPAVGSCPCSAPGVKWSTEAGPQQLAQWCAAKASESLPLLRVDAEHFVLPFVCNPIVDGCIGVCRLHHKVYKQTRWSGKCVFPDTCLELGRPVKEYLLPGSPTVGMICMNHVISSLRTQDTLPEWVSRVHASVRGSTSLQEACDGSAGRPGLEGIVAELADEWSMRLAAAWGRVASQCPHEWVLQLAARFGDTPVPRNESTAPSPPPRPEAPVWSPFAGPAHHAGCGSWGSAPKVPIASHDLTAQSMFHGSVVPQGDGPRHPRLAGMRGLHGSGTVALGPQDHSWSPVPLAGSMPSERQVWDPHRDPSGLASLGGGMIGQPPPTALHCMSSNPMMPGTPVMTGGLASFGIHPGGVAPHGPNLWSQGQMGSEHLPSWGLSHGPNPHDSMHGLASAIGSLQLVLSKGNEDVVRQLERSNRKDEARGGDRHTIAGITREDELLKFALGGCDTQPVALCPGETGKEWIRSMRTAVLERRSDLIKVDCPVKIDFYVALAVSLCSWGIPEDGESPKVYLDAKDFPALGADELQRWRAPPVPDSVLRASGRDPLTIETWAECCGRLAYFFGLVYGRHHESSIVECIAALRRKHNSDSRTWSFLVVQRIFSNLLCRYLTEWRQIVRNVIRLSGLEDPNKSHVRRICQTLGPDGAPVVQPPKVFDLEDPEGHFQKVIYARMQRNVPQALWANAYELGDPKPGARIGGDAAYPQGPKVAPQITRLATKHTDVGSSGLKKCWKFNSHMGCPDGKDCLRAHEHISPESMHPSIRVVMAQFGGHRKIPVISPEALPGYVAAQTDQMRADLESHRNDGSADVAAAAKAKSKAKAKAAATSNTTQVAAVVAGGATVATAAKAKAKAKTKAAAGPRVAGSEPAGASTAGHPIAHDYPPAAGAHAAPEVAAGDARSTGRNRGRRTRDRARVSGGALRESRAETLLGPTFEERSDEEPPKTAESPCAGTPLACAENDLWPAVHGHGDERLQGIRQPVELVTSPPGFESPRSELIEFLRNHPKMDTISDPSDYLKSWICAMVMRDCELASLTKPDDLWISDHVSQALTFVAERGLPCVSREADVLLGCSRPSRAGGSPSPVTFHPPEWVEGVGIQRVDFGTIVFDAYDYGQTIQLDRVTALGLGVLEGQYESSQCWTLGTAGALLRLDGSIPPLDLVRERASGLRAAQFAGARAAYTALGPMPATLSAVEVDIRSAVHDALAYGHDKDVRMFEFAFDRGDVSGQGVPPEVTWYVIEVTATHFELDVFEGTGDMEAWLLVHRGHLQTLVPREAGSYAKVWAHALRTRSPPPVPHGVRMESHDRCPERFARARQPCRHSRVSDGCLEGLSPFSPQAPGSGGGYSPAGTDFSSPGGDLEYSPASPSYSPAAIDPNANVHYPQFSPTYSPRSVAYTPSGSTLDHRSEMSAGRRAGTSRRDAKHTTTSPAWSPTYSPSSGSAAGAGAGYGAELTSPVYTPMSAASAAAHFRRRDVASGGIARAVPVRRCDKPSGLSKS